MGLVGNAPYAEEASEAVNAAVSSWVCMIMAFFFSPKYYVR